MYNLPFHHSPTHLAESKTGKYLIHFSCEEGLPDITEHLLTARDPLNHRGLLMHCQNEMDQRDMQPIHYAIMSCKNSEDESRYVSCVLLLIKHCAYINIFTLPPQSNFKILQNISDSIFLKLGLDYDADGGIIFNHATREAYFPVRSQVPLLSQLASSMATGVSNQLEKMMLSNIRMNPLFDEMTSYLEGYLLHLLQYDKLLILENLRVVTGLAIKDLLKSRPMVLHAFQNQVATRYLQKVGDNKWLIHSSEIRDFYNLQVDEAQGFEVNFILVIMYISYKLLIDEFAANFLTICENLNISFEQKARTLFFLGKQNNYNLSHEKVLFQVFEHIIAVNRFQLSEESTYKPKGFNPDIVQVLSDLVFGVATARPNFDFYSAVTFTDIVIRARHNRVKALEATINSAKLEAFTKNVDQVLLMPEFFLENTRQAFLGAQTLCSIYPPTYASTPAQAHLDSVELGKIPSIESVENTSGFKNFQQEMAKKPSLRTSALSLPLFNSESIEPNFWLNTNYYTHFNITPNSSLEEIQIAYVELEVKANDPQIKQVLQNIYNVLTNENLKREYNERLSSSLHQDVPSEVRSENSKMFADFISIGANLNYRDARGNSILHLAGVDSQNLFLKYLFDGVLPRMETSSPRLEVDLLNSKNDAGMTPIMAMAAANCLKNESMIRLLADKIDCDLLHKDDNGQDILDYIKKAMSVLDEPDLTLIDLYEFVLERRNQQSKIKEKSRSASLVALNPNSFQVEQRVARKRWDMDPEVTLDSHRIGKKNKT